MIRKILTLGLMMLLALPVLAQDAMTPSVTVADQVVLDGTVTVASVVSDGAGFVVIHRDNEGSFAEVIGNAPVSAGHNTNVVVDIDTSMATGTLYAMLHTDTGEAGVYEFGMVEGADGPVTVDGAVVSPAFAVEVLSANDQFVDGTVTISDVTISQDGFVVIHAGDADSFAEVIGFAAVSAGTSQDVTIDLMGDATSVIWPMLHVDTGEAGEYEFGTVEGADGPVVVGGAVAAFPIWTVPHMRISNQVVAPGDAMMGDDMMGQAVVADGVLSDGPGFVVIHADNDGAPGPVIGFAAVEDGYNANVVVELMEASTSTVWPMLHVDTGEAGVYEFGQVEGADGPVMVDGAVLTFQIEAAPFITYSGSLDGNTITVDAAGIDGPGWLVIHADNDGAPGAVLGQTALNPGVTNNISVTLDEAGMTDTVFPMLHYDTGEAGVYEFGMVEGADGPVVVKEAVITGALTPMMME